MENKTQKFDNAKEKPRIASRTSRIIEEVMGFIEDLKGDEIYNAMKDSEYSKDYAVQRVKEMFEDVMDCEKEKHIQMLEEEILKEKEEGRQRTQELLRENEELLNKLREFEEKDQKKNLQIEEMLGKQRNGIEEELESSKAQTFRIKRELESLKIEKEISQNKEAEYERDYTDLITHLAALKEDKKYLQQEIENITQAHYEATQKKKYLISENELLGQKINQLQVLLDEESSSNKYAIQKMVENFREKSKKFKAKIVSQKKRLEELDSAYEELQKSSSCQEKNLQESMQNESLRNKELEILLSKQEIEHKIQFEGLKKHYEAVMNLKISEMQKEVDCQVRKCQDYEQDVKVLMENKDVKCKEAENSNEELMKQLNSALEGLEQLRNGYSEQLNYSQSKEKEVESLRNSLQELEIESKIQDSKCKELEKILYEEQDRMVKEHRLRCRLEENIQEYEENLWKLKEELEGTRIATANYENMISEYENNLRSENSRFSYTMDKLRTLEDYSKSLESKLQSAQTENFRKSHQKRDKRPYKALRFQVKSARQELYNLKNHFASSTASFHAFARTVLEDFSYKLIEKTAELRKLKSQTLALKKENLSLSNSISICSREFDDLSHELNEKQRSLKDYTRSMRYEIKERLNEKYREKYLNLEGKLQKVESEKLFIQSESKQMIDALREEVFYYHNKNPTNGVSEMSFRENHDKLHHQKEISLMERRISELESFLEAERSQKIQLASLKNSEIEDLKSKLFLTMEKSKAY